MLASHWMIFLSPTPPINKIEELLLGQARFQWQTIFKFWWLKYVLVDLKLLWKKKQNFHYSACWNLHFNLLPGSPLFILFLQKSCRKRLTNPKRNFRTAILKTKFVTTKDRFWENAHNNFNKKMMNKEPALIYKELTQINYRKKNTRNNK